MINNSTNNKLDEAVKTTLNEYEAPFEPSDWSRMESMLDNAAPKTIPFKWSYAIGALIGIAAIGGIYLIVSNSNSTNNTSTAVPVKVEEHTTPAVSAPVKTVPAPVTNTIVTSTDNKVAAPVITEPTPKTEAPADVKKEDKALVKEEHKKEEKRSKKDKTSTKDDDLNLSNVPIMGMGNEPIFGDMLDSSKGIVGETKEKEETKKAAKAHKNTPVGWNSIMSPNVNPDSLRKYREQRDSLKSN